ncbi:murein L,D-transpeptidase [Flavobacterium sp. H122]|uniref:L,D-transpeptidase family protein n=1 Tax=Flavobacterium sp. H122 TaxID=2529860 RepID=UPI0010AA67A9|nr:L,D-transpeptidase family protein [Flavobacterium sp. H122]
MRYFYPAILGFIIYISCANNSGNSSLSTEESIKKALKNQELQEKWDNKENRDALLEAIRKCNDEGLLPEDYNYSELMKYEDAIILTPDQNEAYHKLLTVSAIKFISHIKNGKINPNEIYKDWEYTPKPIVNDSIFEIILTKSKIDSLIEASKPKHIVYKNLKKALFTLNTLPEDNFDTIKPKAKEKLFLGLKNSNTIAEIKERLRFWNDLQPSDTLANTAFDENLKKGIISFQKRHGLEQDGKIGPGTLKALNFSKENRKQQIIANLERWRWFPEDLGTNFLAVNLPAFQLKVVENNDTIQTFRVVIGQTKRKTPVLSSKVDNIVFNPTWTVPPTIIREDLIPDATKSRSYFYKNRIKIFNYKNEPISVGKWKPKDALNYKYVQDPGYNNSLGVVKINFNNKHLVYMHDTNHRELFVNNYRALSSGCVRIQEPLPLAVFLLKDKLKKIYVKEEISQKGKNQPPKYKRKLVEVPVYSMAEIDTIVKEEKTKAVKVSQNFNIHFLYFTAWYDGIFNFRHDVYNYDPELYLRLSNQFAGNVVSSAGMIDK